MYIPDNYDLYRQYEAEQARIEKRLPVCCKCGEKIVEDGYNIDDDMNNLYCYDCAMDWLQEQKVDVYNLSEDF